jgi:hypothetical protein
VVITEEQVITLLAECNPMPDVAALDLSADLPAIRLAELDTRSRETTELESEQSGTTPASGRNRLMLGAAAVAVVIAAVVLLRAADTGPVAATNAATVTDQPTASPVEVATAFVKAYGAYDIEQATSYLAPDANLAAFGEDWPLNRKFLDFIGFELILDSCDVETASNSSTTVRCTYDYHALRSEEMGLGPFTGSYFDLPIQDGEIVSVNQHFDYVASGFSSQVWEPFAAWVADTYPEDAAIMYADWPNQSMQAFTDESLSLWEQRSWDYATKVTP